MRSLINYHLSKDKDEKIEGILKQISEQAILESSTDDKIKKSAVDKTTRLTAQLERELKKREAVVFVKKNPVLTVEAINLLLENVCSCDCESCQYSSYCMDNENA